MLNRRGFFSYLAGALGLAAVPVVAKSDYVPAMVYPGEYIINRKYANLWISPEALADIRSWDYH